MNLLPPQLESAVRAAIVAAQTAGDLPAFDLPESLVIKRSDKPALSDYASPVALQIAKAARRAPLDVAGIIVQHMPALDCLDEVFAAPPGFLNFRLSESWLREQVDAILAAGDRAFTLDLGAGQRAQVEFVSANPTGPLHIGRTRGAVIGDTMARLLEALGYAVEREYYFNNAGRQMELLGKTLQARYLQVLGRPAEIPEEGYKGGYMVEIARDLAAQVGDSWAEADWPRFKEHAEQVIFGWIRASLHRMNVYHDVFFNENSLYETGAVWQTLERLREGGYIYSAAVEEQASDEERAAAEAKGLAPAQWFRSTAFGDEKDRVMVKASGEPTYTLPDVAYHCNKFDRGFNYLVNVLGADHGTQYQTVQRGLKALGYNPDNLDVIIHQMVRIYRGGELVRGSTRAGDVIAVDEVMDEVGTDAVRYFILARSPNTDVDFDLDLAIAQNNENPVFYIQNAHVRCAGIFRQAQERGISDEGADLSLLGASELAFIKRALELPEVIVQSVRELAPHKIAFFALELARLFHPMYDEVRALHGEVPLDVAKARLRFYRAAQVVFRRVLTLMGMSAPERM